MSKKNSQILDFFKISENSGETFFEILPETYILPSYDETRPGSLNNYKKMSLQQEIRTIDLYDSTQKRFSLLKCPNETLIRYLCEVVFLVDHYAKWDGESLTMYSSKTGDVGRTIKSYHLHDILFFTILDDMEISMPWIHKRSDSWLYGWLRLHGNTQYDVSVCFPDIDKPDVLGKRLSQDFNIRKNNWTEN